MAGSKARILSCQFGSVGAGKAASCWRPSSWKIGYVKKRFIIDSMPFVIAMCFVVLKVSIL